MEILNLKGTEDTPTILLDKKNGILKLVDVHCPKTQPNFTDLFWIGSANMLKSPTLLRILLLNWNISTPLHRS